MPEPCACPQELAHNVAYSHAEQVHIIMPADCNQSFRLFGGKLMEWVDIVAAVVARRHSAGEVTTAAIDRLDFLAPAKLNDIVVLDGRLVYVGRTSMLICVDTFVEDSDCDTVTRKQVNRAYVTMVALGKDKQPMAVPRLLLETDEDREAYAVGKARREASRRAPV
ncbi:MAG TPA: acyl-CoA thioesterase [Candidatus Limiplasma sp.]|nr:acyl-CoA thioesterase [Candidatus Limiplasma sp.]HPS80888.1 acyl-CoA thioesterase [Candidatus Limiplasma sp.]